MIVCRITVAICTWNRSQLLERTLEELTKLVVPSDVEWDLLVVNNNCTDATDDVIARFAGRLPVRRLFEPTPGLSHARNLAVREAAGDYVLWTDDDVLVGSDWLAAYSRAFARWPVAVVFGGPIEPWFPGPSPSWLQDAWPMVANAYACIDYGRDVVPLTDARVPFGANMAIRTDCQRMFPFDPDRGVRPGSRVGGEETDVVRKLLNSGRQGCWVPDARVRHYIPEARQTLGYLRQWYFGYGEYLGRFEEREHIAHLFGRPRWLLKQAIVSELRYRVHRYSRTPATWVLDLIAASTARGQIHGYGLRAK